VHIEKDTFINEMNKIVFSKNIDDGMVHEIKATAS
jgi:hypothetical protein